MADVLSFFKKLGSLIKRALQFSQDRGLTDQVIELAKSLALQAANAFANNTEKREWVVAQLRARGISESIARLAVELAVQLIKNQQAA